MAVLGFDAIALPTSSFVSTIISLLLIKPGPKDRMLYAPFSNKS